VHEVLQTSINVAPSWPHHSRYSAMHTMNKHPELQILIERLAVHTKGGDHLCLSICRQRILNTAVYYKGK
jgi:hypothetical protein